MTHLRISALLILSLPLCAQYRPPGGTGTNFTAGGDLSGSVTSQQVIGLKTVPFCTGFTPSNGEYLEYTTASSPNPCYTAAVVIGSGVTLETNGTSNSLQSVLNLMNAAAFNGLTLSFSNPSGGNVQPAFGGTLNNSGLSNSAVTIAGASISLGGSTSSFPSPGAIGGTTPAAGTFTTLTATGNTALDGTVTANALSTTGTVAGSVCATSAGLILYQASGNCYSGTANLAVQVNGAAIGSSATLNFQSGNGVTQNCVYSGGVNICTPDYNPSLIPTHTVVHNNENAQASANGTTALTSVSPNLALPSYQAYQCWDIFTDTANPVSLNIDGVGVRALKLMDGTTNIPAGVIGANSWFRACDNGSVLKVPGTQGTINTTGNCSSSASPAVCGSAAAGSIAFPTGTTNVSLTVDTTAVTANSQIFIFPDSSLGTKLGITCNSTLSTLAGGVEITARTPGTSFTATFNSTIATNALCASYLIVN